MTAGKILASFIIGSVAAVNVYVIPADCSAAVPEASQISEPVSPGDDFTQEIRAEHEIHEQILQELRSKYPDPADNIQLNEEMRQERNRHDNRMREIHNQYYSEAFPKE